MLLFSVVFAGCLGTIATSDGPEPVRAALWFPDSPYKPAVVPYGGIVLVANSPLHCEPEVVEDDPATPADEEVAALVYWQGELASAFTREEAWVVLLSLYSRGEERDGTYTLSEQAVADPAAAIALDAHAGYGAWLHVEESEVDDLDGLFYVYEPQRVSYNLAVQAPAQATLEERGGRFDGTFGFSLDGLSGTFRAEECENTALLYVLWQYYQAFPSMLDDPED